MPQLPQEGYHGQTTHATANSGELQFLDQAANACRVRHFSCRTEQSYIAWIKRFILFHNKRYPKEMEPQIFRSSGMVQKRPFSGNTWDLSADPDRSRIGANAIPPGRPGWLPTQAPAQIRACTSRAPGSSSHEFEKPKGDIAIRGRRLENLGQMQICPCHLFNRGQ